VAENRQTSIVEEAEDVEEVEEAEEVKERGGWGAKVWQGKRLEEVGEMPEGVQEASRQPRIRDINVSC